MRGFTSSSRRNPANMTAAQRMADGGALTEEDCRRLVEQILTGGQTAPMQDGSQSNPLNNEIGRNVVNTLSALPGAGPGMAAARGLRSGAAGAAQGSSGALAVPRANPATWEVVQEGGALAARSRLGASPVPQLGVPTANTLTQAGQAAEGVTGAAQMGLPGPAGQLARTSGAGRSGIDMSGTTAAGTQQLGQSVPAASTALSMLANPATAQGAGQADGSIGRYAAGAAALGATASLTGANSAIGNASSQDAGAGRGIYSDPRFLGNPGPISAQSKVPSAADTMAQLSTPNPKASAGNGNVNVTRQPNGVLSFSGEPNISGPVTYNAGTSGFKPSGAGVTSMPAAVMMSASPSTDAALSSARFAAAARGDMDAVRDSYFAQGQSFGGQTRESVQDDSLQRLGMAPLGTPGRDFAQKLVQSRLQEQTQRRGQDITASQGNASNQIAQRKLDIEAGTAGIAQKRAATEDAQKVRVAQLDDRIMNGNPFQQRAAAAQKAAMLGKGLNVSDADKVAQQQGRDTQDIFGIIESAGPLLANTTGSLIGTGIDKVGSAVGYSTQGAKTTSQLKALQGALIGKMPKMSGPQSDRDVELYREMAGKVGDSTIPTDQRQAALTTIRDLNEKYLPRVISEAEAMSLPPGSTFRTPDGKIRRTPQ